MVSKSLAGYGLGPLVGDVINVGTTIKDYSDSRKEGNSIAVSGAKAAASFLSGEIYYSGINSIIGNTLTNIFPKAGGLASFPVTFIAMAGLQMAVPLANAHAENTAKIMEGAYSHRGKFGSGHFDMTEAGYTMRQRSLNAIRSNGLNTQSVLGNEARTYYRGAV